MSSVIVALMFAAGVAAWTYAKVSRSTGGASTKNSLIVTGLVGSIAFLIALSILSAISG